MQVGHGFTGIVAVIDYQPEAGITGTDAQLPGHFPGGEQQATQQGLILCRSFADTGNHTFGHDQHMNGGLRIDVAEGKRLFVLVDDVRRKLPGDDSFKDSHGGIAVGGHPSRTGAMAE